MCEASKAAKTSADAVDGAVYAIGQVRIEGTAGMAGALYAVGSNVGDCIFCIKTGQKLTLSNIPELLQRKHGIDEVAVAVFKESREWHRDDVLDFGNGKCFHFRCFADCGIIASVGEKHVNTSRAVADLLAQAQSGARSECSHETISA